MEKSSVPVIILLCGAILCMMIGYAAPGWYIVYNQYGVSRWYGLWFEVRCTNANGSCETKSHMQTYLETHRETQYAYQVGSKVLATLSLAAAIVGCVLTILGLRNSQFSLIYRVKTVRCFVFSAVMIWRAIGGTAAEINILRHIYPEQMQGFPYALFLSALGSVIILFIGVWNFVSTQKQIRKLSAPTHEESSNQTIGQIIPKDSLKETYTPLGLILLFIMTAFGCLFQLAGFVSPGWVVKEGIQSQFNIVNEFKMSATGLWYYIACKSTGACKSESLLNFYKSKIEQYSFYEIDYSFVVGNQVTSTLSMLVSGLAALIGLISVCLKERSVLLMNITELCCLLSACLMWQVIGEILGNTFALIRDAGDSSRTTYQFPYSLFLSAIGSLLIFLVYLIYQIKFICWLYQRRKSTSEEQHVNSFEFSKL